MKPARPESGRADVRRARLLVTRLLGLVAGFPEGEAWVELVRGAPPVISTLDRTRLARATRWLTSLRGEYRAVLPEVVGDAEAWVRVVAARLDALKPLVHDGVRPSIDAPEALRWVLVLEPERLARALAFAPSLPPRPLVEQVRLALMASDDPEAARCWVAALAIAPVPAEVEIRRSRQALATACGAAKRPQVPTLAPAVAGLAPLLVERSLRELAELGPLLAPLLPTMALAADAWAEVEALHAALSARLGLAELPTAALAARADALAARPIPVDGAELARALRQLVGTPLVATIAEGVAALPEVDRGRFVEHWALLAETRDEAFVAAVVRGLGRHVAAGRSLAPWAKAGRFGHTYNTPESGLPDRPSAAFFDGYYELCAALHDEGLDADTLGALVQVDAPRALARARALAAVEGRASYYGDEAVRLAHALVAATPDDAARFAAVLAAQRLDIAERVQVGALALLDLGVPPAGVAALLVEETGRLEALGATRAMARRMKVALPALPAPTIAWDPIDPHAGLAAELAWLVAHDGPPERIANLRARLATPAEPTAAQRARHELKRVRLLARAGAEALQAELDARIAVAARALLGVDAPWLGAHTSLVAAAAGLSAPYRELALELLRRRAGPPPWDPRDHPKNVAFLERLAPRVRDVAPWVEGRRWPLADGRVAALDPDPLAVLRMGEPFGTCLTPGHINFFSAVVNAVDVNKRVLFVRDARGAVVARCLLALTEHGALVTHRIYCAGGREALRAEVEGCIRALAAEVGLTPLARASIAALLAPRWYDDGPVALADASSAALDQALRAPEVDADAVAALFGTVPEALWLAVVLHHEAGLRPQLLRALRPRFLGADLSDDDRLLAAQRFDSIDDAEAVTRLLSPCALRLAQQALEDDCGIEAMVGEVALRLDPAALLRLIRRRARPGRYTPWHWVSRCLAALGRPRQAEAAAARLD